MNNEHDIDKLLKESFDNFSPEAPNVWQAVQQGVQAAQVSAAASSGVVGATVQGVSLGVKMIAGIVIAAASITGYIVLNNETPKETPQPTHTVVNEVKQPEVLPEKQPTPPSESLQSELVQPQKPTAKAEHKVTQAAPSVINDLPVSTPAQENTVVQTETKKEVQESAPGIVKENPVSAETPKATGITGTKEQAKPAGTKSEKPSALPYNPYAQDGEEYEKPFIPGSFSPNNDGLNDKFKILIENETYYSLMILNDKGELVFESKSSELLWDGKHYKTGVLCPAGIYIYRLNYQYKGSEKSHEESGMLKLF